MPDVRHQIHATMRALVQSCGATAVASILAARWGKAENPGTLSKKMSGALDWTILDLLAIEDAEGRYPLTALLQRRVAADTAPEMRDIAQIAACAAKEAGEALSALLVAQTPEARAAALVEIDEVIEAFSRARTQLAGGAR